MSKRIEAPSQFNPTEVPKQKIAVDLYQLLLAHRIGRACRGLLVLYQQNTWKILKEAKTQSDSPRQPSSFNITYALGFNEGCIYTLSRLGFREDLISVEETSTKVQFQESTCSPNNGNQTSLQPPLNFVSMSPAITDITDGFYHVPPLSLTVRQNMILNLPQEEQKLRKVIRLELSGILSQEVVQSLLIRPKKELMSLSFLVEGSPSVISNIPYMGKEVLWQRNYIDQLAARYLDMLNDIQFGSMPIGLIKDTDLRKNPDFLKGKLDALTKLLSLIKGKKRHNNKNQH